MKLLLDEQVPARHALEFPENFDVHTFQEMGWASAKNGKLLKLAAAEGFVALFSTDKNLYAAIRFGEVILCLNLRVQDETFIRKLYVWFCAV
ncbi:hypothetical protein N9383_02220 [Granulosicoccus sp.]|nr:hypothetical protein [Granulosicoccus sp.]